MLYDVSRFLGSYIRQLSNLHRLSVGINVSLSGVDFGNALNLLFVADIIFAVVARKALCPKCIFNVAFPRRETRGLHPHISNGEFSW
jgi:hypothetical protein